MAVDRDSDIEAYDATGGVVRRDLFDDDQSRLLSDPGAAAAADSGQARSHSGRGEGGRLGPAAGR